MSVSNEKLENLLDENQPSKVVSLLKKYNGTDGETLFLYGEAERMLGNFEPAIKIYERAAKYAKTPELKIEILLALAASERTLGRAESAYQAALAARVLADSLEFEEHSVYALQEMAMAMRAYGALDESMDMLNEVLAYYTEKKDYSGMSFILWAKGGIFRLKGQFVESKEMFKRAAANAKKAVDKISLAYAYCGLAGVSRICAEVENCVKYYKMAEVIFKNTEDTFGKAYTNCGMANGLRQLGKYNEAWKKYIEADKLYSQIGDKVDLGFVKWGKADVLKKKGKLKEALVELWAAKEFFASSDEKRGQILTEISIAQTLYALGQKEDAVKIYDAAVAAAKKEGLNTYLEIYT